MKIAIIGSRNLSVKNLEDYIPENVTEIVSGGAKGIDSDAANYAMEHRLKLKVFLPEYDRYKRAAPLKRNIQIAEYADECLAFWDGSSKGTLHTVELFRKLGKNVTIIKK
jgi:predicted Rossmann fold nucleotide-binding protein DprA/Smf involved in DNA uptake